MLGITLSKSSTVKSGQLTVLAALQVSRLWTFLHWAPWDTSQVNASWVKG